MQNLHQDIKLININFISLILILTAVPYLSAHATENIQNIKERESLVSLFNVDQQTLTSNIDEKIKLQIQLDHINQLKNIINKIGWPSIDKVGEKANQGAFIIAQHADIDLAFQKYVLKLMEKSFIENKTPAKHLAYLYDRVAKNSNQPQLYGTQGYCVENNRWQPREIAYQEMVDMRRHAFGLSTLSDYITIMNRACETKNNKNIK